MIIMFAHSDVSNEHKESVPTVILSACLFKQSSLLTVE